MVLAARLLDIADFADLALAAALCAMAVQVADIGVAVQLPQAFAEGAGTPVAAIRQAFRRRLLGGLAVSPLLVGAFLAVAARPSFAVAAGFAVSAIATAAYGAGYVALRALDAYGLETVLEPAGRVVVLGAGAYVAASGRGLIWIAWSYALADLLLLAVIAAVLHRRCRGAGGGPLLGRFTWLVAAGPIGMVYWRADIWLLAALATSRQVALYGSSYRLLDAALLPALVLAQLFLAPFARCDPDRQWALLIRWIRGAVLAMLPFAVVAALLGRPVLTLLFGRSYAGGSTALAVLALAGPLTAAAFLLTAALAVIDPRSYVSLAVLALGVNVVGNLLFAGHLGATGAAAVTLVSQGLLVATQWVAVRRRLIHAAVMAHPLAAPARALSELP